MSTDNELLQKQKELKDTVTKGTEYIIPAYFFNFIGDWLVKIFRLQKRPHWVINAIVLDLLIFLPGFLIAILRKEIYQWGELHLSYFGLLLIAFLGPIVSHINMTYNVLPGIRDSIIDSIQDVEDLDKFTAWLSTFWSVRKWLVFSIVAGILSLPFITERQIGFGLFAVSFLFAPFLLSPMYIIFKMLTLPPLLSGFKLILYESDPVNSEVIQHLINILNIYIYFLAGYYALTTSYIVIYQATNFIWFIILVAWLPTITQFIVNQYSVRKIIIAAKWKNLNRLQKEIRDLQNSSLKGAPDTTIVRINQLMDLHDRISKRPNSMLNWGTGLSFLNQLMLPLLGLFLGNIDKLLNLLKP